MKKTIILTIAAMMAVSFSSATAMTIGPVAAESSADQQPKKKKGEVKDVTFDVALHCENCVAKVFDNLSRAKGVKDLDVSLEKQTVAIKYDDAKTSEQVLKETIEKLGYPVGEKHEHSHDHGHAH